MKPLAIDLYCGLGGWAEGFLAEGYDVIGFDIERHDYGTGGYPGQLVLQDVLTLHGWQFKNAAVIVASPPCQGYSYRAMPWKRAKALPPPDNSLFWAPFRIQAEACEANGRYIPLIVENVKGAQPWVGRARWHFGNYYLWGDVPALMPITQKSASVNGMKTTQLAQMRDGHGHTRHLTNQREHDGLKVTGIKLSNVGFNVAAAQRFRWNDPAPYEGRGKRRDSRKAASAQIAKIPFPLARHIAQCFRVERAA